MRIYLLASFILLSVSVFSQSLYPEKVTVTSEDQTVVAYTEPVKKEIAVKTDKYYHWFKGGQIRVSQGGYSGKLLNGSYEAFYPDKALKEKGEFKKGLKQGLWNVWYTNGNLQEQTNWKEGFKNGKFKEYTEEGELKLKGRYKKGELDGKVFSYVSRDSILTNLYDSGKPVIKKEKVKKDRLHLQKVKTKVKGWVRKLVPQPKKEKKSAKGKP